ncbi:hypothetical protein SYNPS1DRAFT_30257 [Syncephalis pseudoplumigaleata]|nr:hypothetical protein SYNPS1DRAFT_30257 [Syncephalis pseudoplumigaleata]|eukprot:RKP23969.1 hypothetical protein SYNPS1DRAFT_30257 [Syncephalis pseudoplumigaleata]
MAPITVGVLHNAGIDDPFTRTAAMMPTWSQLIEAKEFVPLIVPQQLLVLHPQAWSILDLNTGALLRRIETQALDEQLSRFHWNGIARQQLDAGALADACVVTTNKKGNLLVVDLVRTDRARVLDMPESSASYGTPVLHGGSANALVVEVGDKYVIVDAA